MLQPADIAVEESAQIGHAVFEHSQTVDPDAKGKALPLVRIKPCHLDHAAVDHAAAQQLHPVMPVIIAIAADNPAAALFRITNIHLDARFSEREVAGAQAQHDVVAFEKCL